MDPESAERFDRARRRARAARELNAGPPLRCPDGLPVSPAPDAPVPDGRAPAIRDRTRELGIRRVESPLGALVLGASERGITHLQFEGSPKAPRGGAPDGPGARHLDRAEALLARYFEGRPTDFGGLPLDLRGTAFQLRVWSALRRIPFGRTRSYGEVAALLGRPGAARAVGLANHHNPVAIIVPCHRVVGAGGALTGYGGGLARKRFLLELEAAARLAD